MALFLFSGTSLFTNCASNFVIRRSADEKYTIIRDTIFVENPDLSFEYEILLRSKIFTLSDDSATPRHLELWPINERAVRCATPIAFTFLTLGIVPGILPHQYNYGFTLQENETVCTTMVSIDGGIRFSFWDWFAKPFLKKEKVIAEGLRRQVASNNLGWHKRPYMIDVH